MTLKEKTILIQRALNVQLAKMCLPLLVEDGIYGDKTASAVITVYGIEQPAETRTLYIDIGHSGVPGSNSDTSARAVHDNKTVTERSITTLLADDIAKAAKAKHPSWVIKILDYEEDSNTGDLNRTISAIRNTSGRVTALSLHMDSAAPSAQGGHAIYEGSQSKALAQRIGGVLGEGLPGRAELAKWRDDLGLLGAFLSPQYDDFEIVMIEGGFVTNAGDVAKMQDPAFRAELAEKIVDQL